MTPFFFKNRKIQIIRLIFGTALVLFISLEIGVGLYSLESLIYQEQYSEPVESDVQTVETPKGPIINWEDSARAGYKLQKGELTEDDIWFPSGNSSLATLVEHGYNAGILLACAEGYRDDSCQEAEQYAKEYTVNMDVP